VRILAVSGSLQARSGNRELLRAAAAAAPAGVEVVVFDGIRDLPLFDPDLEPEGGPPPPAVGTWREALRASDGVLIASPEYGHSLPGALKNAIDWVIGSGELHQKPVAITAAVPSLARGRRGLAALRRTLLAVDASLVGGDPIARGEGFAPAVAALLEALLARVRTRA
jgi:chromate reductase, NAD(P)H dehydrogenase (quinone)